MTTDNTKKAIANALLVAKAATMKLGSKPATVVVLRTKIAYN